MTNIFKYICQANKYNEIVWLFLMSLDKMGKEKDEFQDLNSQLENHINDLKVSTSALKETFISNRHRAETDKLQTQNLTWQVAKLPHKLNSQALR